MSTDTPAAGSRTLPRSFIIVVFGPLVGTIVFYLTLMLPNASADLMTGLYATLWIFGFGWVIGLPAAGLAAIAWRWSKSEAVRGAPRWLRALAIGAVCGVVGGVPGMMLLFGFRDFSLQGVLLFALAGGIALAVTAIPGARR